MSEEQDAGAALLMLCDAALPHVYGYLLSPCGQGELAEDLTSDAFLAASDAIDANPPPQPSTAWVIGIARHKLVDHWRRQARDERRWTALASQEPAYDDPWDVEFDALVAQSTLCKLAPQRRSALTLRYLDDLSVAQVAGLLDRTVHATEALLVRARTAFRQAYAEEERRDA